MSTERSQRRTRTGGRKTLYNPSIHPVLAKWMARCGLTEEEIGREFKVSRQTIVNWKKKHPEFAESLMEGKDVADARVEDSLYRRATGYNYEEIHTESIEIEGEDGPAPALKVKRILKHVVPDVTAGMYWLNNRQKDRWKAIQQLQVTGKDGESLGFKVVIKPPSAEGGVDEQ